MLEDLETNLILEHRAHVCMRREHECIRVLEEVLVWECWVDAQDLVEGQVLKVVLGRTFD